MCEGGGVASAPLLNRLPIKNILDGLGRLLLLQHGKAALRKMAGDGKNPFPHTSAYIRMGCVLAYFIYKTHSGNQKYITLFSFYFLVENNYPIFSS